MCATTSTSPTTEIDRESTTARTPAALAIRAPAQPKNAVPGCLARIASTTCEAYKSPEASLGRYKNAHAILSVE